MDGRAASVSGPEMQPDNTRHTQLLHVSAAKGLDKDRLPCGCEGKIYLDPTAKESFTNRRITILYLTQLVEKRKQDQPTVEHEARYTGLVLEPVGAEGSFRQIRVGEIAHRTDCFQPLLENIPNPSTISTGTITLVWQARWGPFHQTRSGYVLAKPYTAGGIIKV